MLACLVVGLASSRQVEGQQPSPSLPRGPAVLIGQIWDERRDRPLPGVVVAVAGSAIELATDDHGIFTITFAGGPLVLSFRRFGYRVATPMVQAPRGDTTRVSFFLAPATVVLDRVTVTAAAALSPRLAGFEQRMRQNIGGTFITRAYIEQRNAVATTNILRNINGVRIIDSAGVLRVASARGFRPSLSGFKGKIDPMAPCMMMIGVDGLLKEPGFVLDEILPREIEAIEVYSGPATIPREFASLRQEGFCGLVMLWTRTGP